MFSNACLEVEEQFLLAGTTLRQQHPIKWYSMVKKGEIISNRTNEPERGLLFDGKYKVSSSCLLLLMPRNQCDTLIQDYVSRATGQLLESEESEQSVGSGGSVNYSSSSTSSDQLIEPLPKTSGERERQKQKEQQGKKEHDENIERLKQKRKEELKKEVGKPRLSPSEYSSVQGSSYRGTVKSSGSVGEYWKPDDVKKEYQRSSRNRRRSSHSGRASSSPSYTEEQLR